MHITITGNLGSGKSTICNILKEKYQFEIYSTGKVQRKLAEDMGMTTLEFNQLMRTDTKYDRMIDDATAKISKENQDKDIVFDSRLAWHFVESSFKVFVSVSLEVSAERVMGDNRGDVEKYSSMEEAIRLLSERAEAEKVRYKEIYDLDYMNFSNYDLVIDSTYSSPDLIAEIILEEAKAFKEGQTKTRMLVSPKRIILPDDFKQEDQEEVEKLAKKLKDESYAIKKVIKVKEKGGNYKIVEGHKYLKAALLAKIAFVPIELA